MMVGALGRAFNTQVMLWMGYIVWPCRYYYYICHMEKGVAWSSGTFLYKVAYDLHTAHEMSQISIVPSCTYESPKSYCLILDNDCKWKEKFTQDHLLGDLRAFNLSHLFRMGHAGQMNTWIWCHSITSRTYYARGDKRTIYCMVGECTTLLLRAGSFYFSLASFVHFRSFGITFTSLEK